MLEEYDEVHFKTVFCEEVMVDTLSSYENENYPGFEYSKLVERFNTENGRVELLKNILTKLMFDKAMLGGYRDRMMTFLKTAYSIDALKEFLGLTEESSLVVKQADIAVILNLMDQHELLDGMNVKKYHRVYSLLVNKDLDTELVKLYNSYSIKGSRYAEYIKGGKNLQRRRDLAEKLNAIAQEISTAN